MRNYETNEINQKSTAHSKSRLSYFEGSTMLRHFELQVLYYKTTQATYNVYCNFNCNFKHKPSFLNNESRQIVQEWPADLVVYEYINDLCYL